jgi:hypothetical protein
MNDKYLAQVFVCWFVFLVILSIIEEEKKHW